MGKVDEKKEYIYSDEYFESGHIGLKIWQTIIAIFGWICVVIPVGITILSFIHAVSHGKYGYAIWTYSEGIQWIEFLGIILGFSAAFVAVYVITMTVIQNLRREGTTELWPTFDTREDLKRRQWLESFIEERFGSVEERHKVRYYEVQPEQNIGTHEINDYIESYQELKGSVK